MSLRRTVRRGLRAGAGSGSASIYGLTIPTTRPRLWFNTARLATATTYVASNPFTPNENDYGTFAFSWLTTGNTSHRDTAKTWLLNYADISEPISGGDMDQARYFGETICLVFDWLYDQFSAAERTTLVDRYNTLFEAIHDYPSAYAGVANNYFWGVFRNEILWGIATYDITPTEASTFLGYVFDDKWPSFLAYQATGEGRGGVPAEGMQYGRYPSQYSAIPFETCRLMGRDLIAESTYFLYQNPYFWLYNSTPAATSYQGGGTPHFETLPYNDDDPFASGDTVASNEIGKIFDYAQQYHGASATISQALEKLKVDSSQAGVEYVRALTPAVTPVADYSAFHLDFYGRGQGYLISRAAWDTTSALVRIIMGPHSDEVGHSHHDYGDFLIHRKGRWLTRETTAYSSDLDAVDGGGELVNGTATMVHNCLLVFPPVDGRPAAALGGNDNEGGLALGDRNGPPVVTRLETSTRHAYIAGTLTDAYRNNVADPGKPHRDNAAVVSVAREMVFVKPLETLVVMDRVETNASTVVAMWLCHSETNFSTALDSATEVRFVNGDQTLRITTVLPSTFTRTVRYEGANGSSTQSTRGQYCLQIAQDNAAQQHFLHVLQARDSSLADLTIAYSAASTNHVLDLSHVSKGFARIEFNKGMTSSGGGLSYSSVSLPSTVTAFSTSVQASTVGAAGPVWS